MRRLASGGLLALLLVGLFGPRLTSTGVAKFTGEQRQYAEQAIVQARLHLENPIERVLLAQAIRVLDVTPLPPGTLDHLGTAPCKWRVRVRAYSLFWLPYKTLTVTCGSTGG